MGLTDSEIKKALECCKKDDCDNCPNDFGNCYANLAGYALDLINRQEAENENLNAEVGKMVAENERLRKECGNQSALWSKHYEDIFETAKETAKAEAYKEFCEKLHTEILEARESNFKAKDERIAKSKKYGIPIDVEDSFLMYCDGKIHALDGIDYFAYNLLKELVGDGSGKM